MMGEQITITSVTANTPVDIYYCNSIGESCVYVSTVSTFPFTFVVPSPYDFVDYTIKIVDVNECVDEEVVLVTPTPTASITPTMTQTPTNTPTKTSTPTVTPTMTQTPTITSTTTPTQTPTPSVTAAVSIHAIGQNTYPSLANTCSDTMTLNNLYNYINEANIIPVIGVKLYQSLYNGTLFNPFNGGDRFIKMNWGGNFYAVQIDASGSIISYVLCS
jgi:hypothetical protein